MKFLAVLLSLALPIFTITGPGFGFAGGGGSDSGGGGSSFSSSDYGSSSSSSGGGGNDPIVDLIVTGIFIVFVIVFIAISSKNNKKPKHADHNSTDEEKQIHVEAERIFRQYQADWSNFNLDHIATYATPEYAAHARLMLEALQNLHRVNHVSRLQVYAMALLNSITPNTALPTDLSVEFVFGGLDEIVETTTHRTLYRRYVSGIHETWNFVYDGRSLRLSGISQPTESAPHLVKSLASFAESNQLYYSPDWGRYALPKAGLIFGGSSLSDSDVNNHVIGKWQDVLVQLYTYAKNPGLPSSYYLVGQLNVPKDYLGVIVKSRKTKLKPPKSYQKFEMEWPDFNERYDVYAHSRDALPAFELLNPKFMANLYDKHLVYNIEVIDNVIYIFAPVARATEADYAELLDILLRAYHELKM